MLNKKQHIIEAQADEIAQLHQQWDGISQILPIAKQLQQEIADNVDPLTNPSGYNGDVVAAAYESIKSEWIDEARKRAFYEIARVKGNEFMDRLINEVYARDADKLYQQAEADIIANPDKVAELRRQAIQKVLQEAQVRVGEELSVKDAELAAKEATRIAAIQTSFHDMQQSGEIALNTISQQFEDEDRLHITVHDPDHEENFASALLRWEKIGGAAGWLYDGHKMARYMAGSLLDKEIPHATFIDPCSIVTNPSTGKHTVETKLILGGQLALRPITRKRPLPISTREEIRDNYSYGTKIDDDPATIAVVTFAARPVRTWCDVTWAK